MTAKEARQITAAAKKTAINGIYDKIRIAANEGGNSVIFQGRRIVNKSVIDKLMSGNDNEKFSLEYFRIKDTDDYELISIRW